MLKRITVDPSLEKKIVIGLIISDKFCRDVVSILDLSYFEFDYLRLIAKWTVDYYKTYSSAPRKHIQDVYDSEKDKMKEADSDLVGQLLLSLSNQFEKEERSFNHEYLLDLALSYFEKQSVKLTVERANKFVETGKVSKAVDLLRDYKKVSKITSRWVNPFSREQIKRTFEDQSDWLLVMPGHLGDIMRFRRGWLIGITGSYKRGKSFFLEEIAIQAIMENLKVAFVSLEMDDKSVSMRIYKRLTAMGDEEGHYIYPALDCVKNQNGICVKTERTNPVGTKLFLDGGEDSKMKIYPQYSPDLDYNVCSWCKQNQLNDFVPSSWYETFHRNRITSSPVKEITEKMMNRFGDNFRLLCYPRFSANLGDIKRDLDILEQTEDFREDVLIVDYAGILAPESKHKERREEIDDTWKILGGMASSRHSLVVTAGQATRKAIKKSTIEADDTAEWIGILAHVDAMFSLNQSKTEKDRSVVRVGVLEHRHMRFTEDMQVTVLQQLSLGQINLGSYRSYDKNQ